MFHNALPHRTTESNALQDTSQLQLTARGLLGIKLNHRFNINSII